MRANNPKKRGLKIRPIIKSLLWFSIGAFWGLFLFASFIFIFFQKTHLNTIYPGVMIGGVNFGGKTKDDIKDFFAKKNAKIAETKFVFTKDDKTITVSASELNLGYNETLLAEQAYSLGRSNNVLSNISLVFQAYLYGIYLPPTYHYEEEKLTNMLLPLIKELTVEPVDALFTFQNGKVSAFRPSSDGQEVDREALHNTISLKIPLIVFVGKPQTLTIDIPIRILNPRVTTDAVNNFGIRELIGTGTSLFAGSIPNRVYNITLAAQRLNGILVAPNEVFSFNKALGDVSAFTGYKQAYIIENGRTILGDGGGVCQVSTTLFRSLLDSGLPILNRTAHAYRVSYYEQDSSPGLDATVYAPSVDLTFRNDTGNHLLIQTVVDQNSQHLTFLLYGTKDGRQVTVTEPLISSQTPPPQPLYQDDPNLPRGVIKQVDFAAWGARVTFTRQVVKNEKIIISDKFVSNYRPWQAVYLRGTKE